jgi:hypothetical protein
MAVRMVSIKNNQIHVLSYASLVVYRNFCLDRLLSYTLYNRKLHLRNFILKYHHLIRSSYFVPQSILASTDALYLINKALVYQQKKRVHTP